MSVLNESPEVKAAREGLDRRDRQCPLDHPWPPRNPRCGLDAGHAGPCGPDPEGKGDPWEHLRAVLAALGEATATIANERGEGEGPSPGWRYDDGMLRWSLPLCDYRVTFREPGCWEIERLDGQYWDEDPCHVIDSRTTARGAMHEVLRLDAALRSAP